MPLTPEAAQLLELSKQAMPVPMHQIPVQALREGMKAQQVASTTAIFEVANIGVPTPAGDVPVRVYRPSDVVDLPVLMYLHGGGFAIGDLEMHDDYLRHLSNAAQVVIVSVDYRLAPEHPYPAGLDDCMAVWAWLQGGPAEVPADCSRLGVGGDSAGGALALALALRTRDEGGRTPDAVVSAYGTTEMRVSDPDVSTSMLTPEACEWFWDMYTTDPAQRAEPYCNVAEAEDLAGLGPHLVFTAEYDPTRSATEDYAQRLADAGVGVVLKRYDGVMHGFYTMLGVLPEAQQALDETVTFLKEKL